MSKMIAYRANENADEGGEENNIPNTLPIK